MCDMRGGIGMWKDVMSLDYIQDKLAVWQLCIVSSLHLRPNHAGAVPDGIANPTSNYDELMEAAACGDLICSRDTAT